MGASGQWSDLIRHSFYKDYLGSSVENILMRDEGGNPGERVR